jgi:predicted secreted protein
MIMNDKKRKHYFAWMCFALMLLLCVIPSCKSAEVNLSTCKKIVTAEDQGKDIAIKKGDTLCVKLIAQMGTGFSWQVEKSSPLLKQLGNPLQIPEGKGGPGSADYQIYQFTAQDTGKTILGFSYKRPWEKASAPVKSFEIRVDIGE